MEGRGTSWRVVLPLFRFMSLCRSDTEEPPYIQNIVNTRDKRKVGEELRLFLQPNISFAKRNKVFQIAVCQAVRNDDPETLETILDTGLLQNSDLRKEEAPLIHACVANYFECGSLLFKRGYRLCLSSEDKRTIKKLTLNNYPVVNGLHFYLTLFFGKEHPDFGIEFGNNFWKRAKSSEDPLVKLNRFEAFTSPLYISLKFLAAKDRVTTDTVLNMPQDPNINIPVDHETKRGCKIYWCFSKQTDDIEMSQTCVSSESNSCFDAYQQWKEHDPIRKTFASKTYADHLSTVYPLQMNEFSEIRKNCTKFSVNLLELCGNMEEVNTMLEYKIGAGEANWSIALFEEHKEFVAHQYFQQFIWEKIFGKHLDWINYYIFWKILLITAYLLLFLLFPIVIFLDFFRDADILFEPPKFELANHEHNWIQEITNVLTAVTRQRVEGQPGHQRHENKLFCFFRDKIHRPFFRVFVYLAIEVFFIVCLVLTLVDPLDKFGKAEIQWYDYILWVLIFSFGIDDIIEIIQLRWKYFTSFWNGYMFITRALFLIGGPMAGYGFWKNGDDLRHKCSGNDPVNVGTALIAIASIMAVLQTTRWFLLWKSYGTFIISIIRVLKDVIPVGLIFIIIYVGFSLALNSLYRTYYLHTDQYPAQTMADITSTFSTLFWNFFDPNDGEDTKLVREFSETEFSDILQKTNNTDILHLRGNGTTSLEFSHFVGSAMFASYQGIVMVILFTILVARMNDTYAKVSQKAEMEWKFSKTFMFAKFLPNRAALPPPFRIIYYLALFVRWIKHCSCRRRDKAEKNEMNQRTKEYFNLIRKLVKSKLQIENEHLQKNEIPNTKSMKEMKEMKEMFQKHSSTKTSALRHEL